MHSTRARRLTALATLAGLVLAGGAATAPAAVAGPTSDAVAVHADQLLMAPRSAGWVFTGTAARTQDALQRGLGMWRPGTATATLDVPAELAGPGGATLSITAGADRCGGPSPMIVQVDGSEVARIGVDADHGTYPVPGRLSAGQHTVVIGYPEDVVQDTCDASLKVYAVTAHALSDSPRTVRTFGPPTLRLSNSNAGLWHDIAGGAEMLLWSNASVTRTFTTGPDAVDSASVVVTSGGDECIRKPLYETYVDGLHVGTAQTTAAAGEFSAQTFSTGALAAGTHEVTVTYADDFRGFGCDRNLRLRTVAVVTG